MDSPRSAARRPARHPAALVASLLTALAACSDVPSSPQLNSPVAIDSPAAAISSTDGSFTTSDAASPVMLGSSLAGTPCITSSDSTLTRSGAVLVLTTCTGAATQRLVPGRVGTAGPIKLGKKLCVDLQYGGMHGDTLVARTCSTVASQRWTVTASNEIRGYHGSMCAQATGARTLYAACDAAKDTQKWTFAATTATAPSPTAETAMFVNVVGGRPCMASADSTATEPADVVVGICTGAPAQRFEHEGINATGPIRLGASLCLDLTGKGYNGDYLVLRPCAGTATQNWTVTSSGSIRGVNGRCGGITQGQTTPGTRVIYWSCINPQNQGWIVDSTTPPSTPVPVSPRLTGAAGVLSLMAATNVPSPASQIARGGAWAEYENDFSGNTERLWTHGGASYGANFYDRAMIYYVWWARTGNATYLDRANQLAVAARGFIESTAFKTFPYQLMVDGVALHALVTGDARSANAVARLADYYGQPGIGWWNIIDDSTDSNVDGRTQARILSTLLAAWYLKVPSPSGYDYGVLLRDFMPKILRTQSPTGAYHFRNQCYYDKPYMTGMIDDALIRYYQTFERDARIPVAVKKAVDHIWTVQWQPTTGMLPYIDAYCSTSQEGRTMSAGLNNMVVSGFGFVARITGDASYYTKGDAIFAAGVNGAWLTDHKQFNQEYTSSYRYLSLRF